MVAPGPGPGHQPAPERHGPAGHGPDRRPRLAARRPTPLPGGARPGRRRPVPGHRPPVHLRPAVGTRPPRPRAPRDRGTPRPDAPAARPDRRLGLDQRGRRARARPPGRAGHLTAAVWDATRQPQVPSAAVRGTSYVPPEYVDMLEEQLASLRRLDDRTGGGPLSQRHARIALHEAVTLIHTGRYTAATGNRLLRHAAGTAQLAGWLSFDAMLDPTAHRYLLLAIRIARAAGDTDMVANALGMLAYQHAASGTPDVALRFAHAAVEQSARSVPVVRARACGRLD